MTDLFPYQETGAAFLAQKGRALLADDMGLGKSAQAIRACDALGAERVIVVCPASLVSNWEREFRKFSRRNVLALKVSGKTSREAIQAFLGFGSLDDHEGQNSRQKRDDVDDAVKGPRPLRLDAAERSFSTGAVKAEVHPAAILREEVDHASIGAREGGGPALLSRGFSGGHRYPAFPVDDARHVSQDAGVVRDAKSLGSFPLQTQRAPEGLLVPPSESGLVNRQSGNHSLKSGALGQGFHRGAEEFVSEFGQVKVLLVSYDTAARRSSEWRGFYFDVMVGDEIHYLKTKSAQRTKAIYGPKCDGVGGLVERAKHVFLLTGTPSPNNVSEIWTHLRAVFPEAITAKSGKPMSYWQFVDRFCVTVDNGFGIQIKGGKNLADLKARLAPHVLRRKKEEVLTELPPIRFDTMPLEVRLDALREAEANLPEGIAEALARDGVGGLQAIAGHVATWRRMVGELKVRPLAERILEELEGGLQKVVVFAHHRSVLDGLQAALDGKAHALRVSGDTPSGVRDALVQAFQNTPGKCVFLGQIQAAGTGLTLTAASDLIFAEASWVPAENEQAAMRIHRIGQRNACLVRFATLPGSIDELIMKAVERKMKDIKEVWA